MLLSWIRTWFHKKSNIQYKSKIRDDSKVHPMHVLRQCIEYIEGLPESSRRTELYVHFSDSNSKRTFTAWIRKSSIGLLLIGASYSDNTSRTFEFMHFLNNCLWDIMGFGVTAKHVLCVFNRVVYESPIKLRICRLIFKTVDNSEVTLYNLPQGRPCAIDSCIMNAAATVINLKSRDFLAKKKRRHEMRAFLLSNIPIMPPGGWSGTFSSFIGGVEYLEAAELFESGGAT